MKKIALYIVLIFTSFEVNAGNITVKDGGYSYKGDHWDKTSRSYNSFDSSYYRSYQTEQMKVKSAVNGATSANTVSATIEQQVSKKSVMKSILDKARVGGKTLGKGAVAAAKGGARGGLYGMAFSLALDALIDSKFFWDDEKGDFVRENDDVTYAAIVTKKSALYYVPDPVDEKKYQEFCASRDVGCEKLGFANSKAEATEIARNYCKTLVFGEGKYKRYGDGSFTNSQNTCATDGGSWGTEQKIHIVKWLDYVPITDDEFFDEAEPEADQKPTEWVETSEVKPTGEPTVKVPAGTVAQTDPYTDPNDGKTKQTRWDFDKDGKAKETIIERPDLTPDSPEAPRLNPPSESDTPTGDKDKDSEKDKDKEKEQQEQFDLCEEHPDIMACDKQPEKPELDELPEIPTETVNLKFAPDNVFPSQATCPADVSFVVFEKTYSFSLKPACDLAEAMRAFIIAMAFLMAAFFVVRTVQSEV